jgi:hypothetical protein
MTRYEELTCLISDTYKDIYGVRPRMAWGWHSESFLEDFYKQLCDELGRIMKAERQEEADHQAAVKEAMTLKPLATPVSVLCPALWLAKP